MMTLTKRDGARMWERTGHAASVSARITAAFLTIGAVLLTSLGLCRYRERRARVLDAPPIRYTITSLGTDGGRLKGVYPRFINNRGQITGNAVLASGGFRAFVWENGRFKIIGSPEVATRSIAVNNHGAVLATTQNHYGDRQTHVVIFHDGKMTDTGIVGSASGIDDQSRVVGSMAPLHHAFLYDSGKAIDLGTLGGLYSGAKQINNAGQIVGSSQLASGYCHAFFYNGGKMRDLGALGGGISWGIAINSRGWVVGMSPNGSGGSRWFLFRNGKMEEIAGSYGAPIAINNAGTVLGNYWPDGEPCYPIVWNDGQFFRLQDLIPPNSGWTLSTVTSINDRGQITAQGLRVGGERHENSCILTPTVEGRPDTTMSLWRRLLRSGPGVS